MIKIDELEKDLTDVCQEELDEIVGGDSFGAAIGGGAAFAAAGFFSGGDLVRAVKGGAQGASESISSSPQSITNGCCCL